MPKPNNLRCGTCVFWMPAKHPDGTNGNCHHDPDSRPKHKGDFCGEWRDTWPTTRDIVYMPDRQRKEGP